MRFRCTYFVVWLFCGAASCVLLCCVVAHHVVGHLRASRYVGNLRAAACANQLNVVHRIVSMYVLRIVKGVSGGVHEILTRKGSIIREVPCFWRAFPRLSCPSPIELGVRVFSCAVAAKLAAPVVV